MNIFIRTFNPDINSKTGVTLPPNAPRRGTPDWQEFELIIIDCLKELGHKVTFQKEHPKEDDMPVVFDKRIYVHKTRRDVKGDLYYMQMHLRKLFTIDTNGWGVDNSHKPLLEDMYIVPDEGVDIVRQLSDKLLNSGMSKCPQSDYIKWSNNPPEQFILVPIQIPRDYTILYHSPITVKYFIDSLENWSNATQNHVAFKLHPFNKHDHEIINTVNQATSSYYCHKVEGNIHELIKRSRGVFVINSGTGFEALIHGKPVCTFGYCDYSQVTHNSDIRRIDEARNYIVDYKGPQRQLAYRFIYWYMYRHGYYLDDPNMRPRLIKYLKDNLK